MRSRPLAAESCAVGVPTPPVSHRFVGRRRVSADPTRVPPGEYVTSDLPTLSSGPTPDTPVEKWSFTIGGEVDEPASWWWGAFLALPSETVTVELHCMTKCSKPDTTWRSVSLETLLGDVVTAAEYVSVGFDGGNTTNLTLGNVTDSQAWVMYESKDELLEPNHGGSARVLVPHLCSWKSAKWVRGLTLAASNKPGFWETYGHHDPGDPWLKQLYQGD